jgi:hypothetical protein
MAFDLRADGERRRHEPGGQFVGGFLPNAALGDPQNSRADLFVLQLGEDPLGRPEIADADRLGGRSQDRFDRFTKLGLHVEALRNGRRFGAVERRFQPALQHGLGPFAKSFPALLQLLEQFQTRHALGQLAINLRELALRFAKFAGEVRDRLLRGDRLAVGPRFLAQSFLGAGIKLGHLLRRRRLLLPHRFDLLRQQVVPVRAGLLVNFVARTIRAEPCDGAVKLEKLKLGLLQVLFEFGEFAFDDALLAVALLENRVAAAEQSQLELLVLRRTVALRGDFPELHFQFTEVVPR